MAVQRGQLSGGMHWRIFWLRERLLSWFEHHVRSFPWREPGRSSYELVVAESLLQRTTALSVARAFPGLIAQYPTWEIMAGTSREARWGTALLAAGTGMPARHWSLHCQCGAGCCLRP